MVMREKYYNDVLFDVTKSSWLFRKAGNVKYPDFDHYRLLRYIREIQAYPEKTNFTPPFKCRYLSKYLNRVVQMKCWMDQAQVVL